jgi:5-methylthioadenosine/S-adenosylhomocysteine deaminase
VRVVSADWVVPVEGEPLADAAVAIDDDGRIAAVGPAADLGSGERFAGCAIVPGFVNAHSHLEYAVYAGFGDGLPFVPWIGLHIRRKEALTLDDMHAIATVGAWECLRSGITTVGDCSFSGASAEAAAATGLRALVYLEVFGRDASALDRFHELRERVEPALSRRVRLGVSPHAPYTCTREVYEACAGLGLPVATHLAESPAERDWLVDGAGDWTALAGFLVPPPGTTGVRLLAGAGLLGPHVVAAHCVHVDPDEIGLLAEHRVGVAHCPRSNGYLGCGTAPLAELLAAGVTVSIATDSPASTPSFDLFEELRTAIVAARARAQQPDALPARVALELATLGGARALGLGDALGSLVPGKQADLTVVALDETSLAPIEDPVAAVVLGGSPERVAATLVAGEIRYRRGTTTWPDSTRAARRARSRMLR